MITAVTVVPFGAVVAVGTTTQLFSVVTRADGTAFATAQLVTWTSDNPAVATVDTLGQVHALSPGAANIVAGDSGVVSNKSRITVATAPPQPLGIPMLVLPFLGCQLASGSVCAPVAILDSAGNVRGHIVNATVQVP
jgi:uncharacterized protein YjdB